MKKIVITNEQLQRLKEVAMDLDIYTQTMSTPVGNPNENTVESVEEMIEKLEETLNMLKYGKKIDNKTTNFIFNLNDKINILYKRIKFSE